MGGPAGESAPPAPRLGAPIGAIGTVGAVIVIVAVIGVGPLAGKNGSGLLTGIFATTWTPLSTSQQGVNSFAFLK
jgi:hypothetical protein